MLISHDLNYPSIPSWSRASQSALGLGGCQRRAGARSPKCGQSFVSSSRPMSISWRGGGAGGSSAGAGPQVSTDVTGGPLHPVWRWTPTRLLEQGRARRGRQGQTLGLLCPAPHAARPRNPSPPWPQGTRCPPGRGKNSGWSRESGQYAGSSASWHSFLGPVPPGSRPDLLISEGRCRQLDSGTGGGGASEKGKERKTVVLRGLQSPRETGQGWPPLCWVEMWSGLFVPSLDRPRPPFSPKRGAQTSQAALFTQSGAGHLPDSRSRAGPGEGGRGSAQADTTLNTCAHLDTHPCVNTQMYTYP